MQKSISVVIPTFNRKTTIIRAVNSVYRQDYSGDIEIIIVDDGSTDGTVELINETYGKQIKLIELGSNHGANFARNIGIEDATNELIAFLDADDEWLENKLTVEVERMAAESADVIACGYMEYDGEKEPVKYPRYPIDHDRFLDQIFEDNFVCTPGVIAKKACLDVCKFDTNMPRLQDWDLSIRLAQQFKFIFIDDCLFNHYIQSDSITKNPLAGRDAVRLIMEKNADYLKTHKYQMMRMYKKLAFFCMQSGDFKKNYYLDALSLYPLSPNLIAHFFVFEWKKLTSK